MSDTQLTDAQKAQLQSLIDEFLKAADDPELLKDYKVAVTNTAVSAATDLAQLETDILQDGTEAIQGIKKTVATAKSETETEGALADVKKKLFG